MRLIPKRGALRLNIMMEPKQEKKSVPVSTVKVKCEGRQNCIIDNHDLAYCKHNVTTYEFQYVDQLLQHLNGNFRQRNKILLVVQK